MANITKTKNIMRVIGCFLILFIILVVMYLLFSEYSSSDENIDYAGGCTNGTEEIVYNNKTYQYNHGLWTILLIGTDSTEKIIGRSVYGSAGRADSINLIVVDRDNNTIKIIPLSRDIITSVSSFSAEGNKQADVETHLGFAFTFGDGGKESCLNVCHAVSDLLGGIQIDDYAALNVNGLALPNRLIGGVSVVVPNNDLSDIYPEMFEGNEVMLSDLNIVDFLRYRDTGVIGSNNGRMERACEFLRAFIEKAKGLTDSDIERIWYEIKETDGEFATSLSDEEFGDLASYMKEVHYDASQDLLMLSGDIKVEDGYEAVYLKEDDLIKLIVETFYEKKG